ncbi:MAG: hypothetical protein KC416_10025 [Myxococcales bacterium]|nr:hypothetical protein [Myxococcales bacterium]
MQDIQIASIPPSVGGADRRKALKIIAKSVYKELKAGGLDRTAMVGFTSELLDLVTLEIRADDQEDAA